MRLREVLWPFNAPPAQPPLQQEARSIGAGLSTFVTDGIGAPSSYVSEETSLSYIPVFAAVRRLAESVASCPLDTFAKGTEANTELPNPFWLDAPNVEMTRFEFIERVMTSLLLWGNAYIALVRNEDGSLFEMWPIDPCLVTLRRDESTRAVIVKVQGEDFSWPDVLHIKGLSYPGLLGGVSPIQIARNAISAGRATDEFASRFWSNGAQPGGIIEIPGDADEDFARDLAQGFNTRHQGVGKAHRLAVLSGGAKYVHTAIPPEDAQFLETRRFQKGEIASLYGLPPHLIGDLSHATYSNIEHQQIEYVTHTLRPWFVRLESALNRLVAGSQFFKFNEKALLRGDSASQADYLTKLILNGAMTLNEARAKLEMNPVEGGDARMLPLAYKLTSTPEMTLADKVNILGALIRAGFEPAASLSFMGMEDITHTGLPSLTLYSAPADDDSKQEQTEDQQESLTQ